MHRSSLVALALLAGCGPAPSTMPPARTVLSTATADSMRGELSSTKSLAMGLSTVWLTLTENGAPITDATVMLMPKMTMPNKMHACPVVGEVVHEGAGVYRGQLVFQMASGDEGAWTLGAKVLRGGTEKLLTFELVVGDGPFVHAFNVPNPNDATMSTRYVMSVSFPEGTKVGLNPIVVTVHRMKDMMTFPAFDEAAIEMVPEMPAHGHGSSKNVAPILTAPGRYEGTVNLSMPGEWKITFTLKAAGALLTTKDFTTSL